MRVLVFGANGQIGRELLRCAGPAGAAGFAADRAMCDLSVKGAAARLIDLAGCDVVINAAAYTAVDTAESESALAHRVNAAAPGEIAEACARRGIPLAHFSTDYVFDGSASRPYREIDATSPLGVYGRSKLEGERAVAAAGGAHAIVRTSWVFSPHGANFVKTMLRLSTERDRVRVVADQLGKPTCASDAAAAAFNLARALIAEPALSGVYHFAGDEAATWAAFAEEIFKAAGAGTIVERITTADYPTAAKRPLYSVLDTSKAQNLLGAPAPSWRRGVRDVVGVLRQSSMAKETI